MITTFVVATIFLFLLFRPDSADLTTLILLFLAMLIESAAEPFYIALHLQNDHRIPLIVEITASFSRALTSFLLFRIVPLELHAFAAGHLAYSIVLLMMLKLTLHLFYSEQRERPQYTHKESELLLLKEFQYLSFESWLFQEGVPYLLIWFQINAKELADYALITNLSGLLVRHLFHPMELAYFHDASENNLPLSSLKNILLRTTGLQLILLILSLQFGAPFLVLLYGHQYGDASSLLSLYLIYITFSTLFGISSAFIRARASPNTLHKLWTISLIISLCESLASFFLIPLLSSYGLVLNQILFTLIRLFIVMRIITKKPFFFGREAMKKIDPSL
jgi:O-antigen/teichoic acid export membrane protein